MAKYVLPNLILMKNRDVTKRYKYRVVHVLTSFKYDQIV
jgi:hypothetical protein